VDRRSGADHAGRELSRAHAGQAQAQGLEVGAHEPGHDHTGPPDRRAEPWSRGPTLARGTRPTWSASREPGHDHAAHVPDVGEHPARGRARDTGGSRGPPDRRAGAGTAGIRRRARARVWTSASTIASWARAPGHELSTRRQAGAGPTRPGRGRRRAGSRASWSARPTRSPSWPMITRPTVLAVVVHRPRTAIQLLRLIHSEPTDLLTEAIHCQGQLVKVSSGSI
jgi:hypothetical protein